MTATAARRLVPARAVALALALCLAAAGAAFAQDAGAEHATAVGSEIRIAPGESAAGGLLAIGAPIVVEGTSVGDAIAVSGDVEVRGRVQGDALALCGDVTVAGPGAVVEGNAFAVMGSVTTRDGGTITGQVRSLWPRTEGAGRGYFAVAYSRPVLVLRLLHLMFWTLAAMGAAILAPKAVVDAATELRAHALQLTGIGVLLFASLLLTLVLFVALIQVFVGIPLLVLLTVVWLGLAATALATLFHAVGERIGERFEKGRVTGYAKVLAGALVLGVLHFVPVVGELAWLLGTCAGAGALVATRRRPAASGG